MRFKYVFSNARYYAPAQGALSDDAVCLTSFDVCLSDVCRVHPVGGRRMRPAGWMARIGDRARLGRSGSRLPLRASVAGLGGGISLRPSAYSLFELLHSTGSSQSLRLYCILNRSIDFPSCFIFD